MPRADHRKLKSRLLSSWPSIPIEVCPIAAPRVLRRLRELGSPNPIVRSGLLEKAGPVKTDQDFFIVDAPFKTLITTSDATAEQDGSGKDGVWEAEKLAVAIKEIQGVLEVGLFVGKDGVEIAKDGGRFGGMKPVAAYFGMEDGSVVVRERPGAKDKGVGEEKKEK